MNNRNVSWIAVAILSCFVVIGSLTAAEPTYRVAYGSLFTVNAKDVPGLTTFTKKPQLFCAASDGKRHNVRVVSFTSEAVVCLFGGEAAPGTYALAVKSADTGNKPVNVSSQFLVQSPLICMSSVQRCAAGDLITITGMYFGAPAPKLSALFAGARGHAVKRNCVMGKDSFPYKDVKGKPSCMEPSSGQSQLTFIVPKDLPEGSELVLQLKIKNTSTEQSYNTPAPSDTRIRIDIPSEQEKVFAEKRDLYVIGYFDTALVQKPGDVRVELYARGESTPIRVVQSQVDPDSGVTSDSSLDLNYVNKSPFSKLNIAPDIVTTPGGFLYPGNKVLVTKQYCGALLLGGATKDFDTSYTDEQGNPLRDLTQGVYVIKITGVSGDISGFSTEMTIYFQPVRKLFGPFSPDDQLANLKNLAARHGFRRFIDPFPGYFFLDFSTSYIIDKRWSPQNAIEVVNTTADVVYGTAANAQMGFIIYNIKETGATNGLEICGMLKAGLSESASTYYYRYDIGESTLTYVDAQTLQPSTLSGKLTRFAPGDRLQLSRGEITSQGSQQKENFEDMFDETPKTLDLDLSDGVTISQDQRLSVFGTATPIPANVTPIPDKPNYYTADNRITKVHYQVLDQDGAQILDESRTIQLDRKYEKDKETLYPSIYEFKHIFTFGKTGTYTVSLTGEDAKGGTVSGTTETFKVTVK